MSDDPFEQRCDEMADSYELSAQHNRRMADLYTGKHREMALMRAAEFEMKAKIAREWKYVR